MVEASVKVKYSGERFSRGMMDAYQASDALTGVAKFSEIVAAEIYGPDCKVKAHIQGFSRGSAEFQIFFDLINVSGELLAMLSAPNGLFDTIKSVIEFYKFLKGEPPKSTKKAETGGMIVENNEGDITQVNGNVYNVTLNLNSGDALEKFVKKGLRAENDELSMVYRGEEIAHVAGGDSKYFKTLPMGQKLSENQTEMVVRIAAPILHGNARWKFHDGRGMLSAEIEDLNFLERVHDGSERFGAGDVLRVRMRCIQRLEKNKPKAEYFVEEVLGHETFTGPENTVDLFEEFDQTKGEKEEE